MARGRSSIRTATDSLQEKLLERLRALAEDPTLLLPESVGVEAAAVARLRRTLEQARDSGRLPFMARFDKGILGALRTVQHAAKLDSVPRLLDARVDGNRRFYLQRGHTVRLVGLGVQNHDDPLALLLAYGPLATRHRLNFFAGSRLWCTGSRPAPPAQWFADLGVRTGLRLAVDSDGGRCPHAETPRIELRFRGGLALVACGSCGRKAGHLHGHILNRALCGDQPSHPVELGVLLADGTRLEVPESVQAAYRKGTLDELGVLEQVLKAWRGAGTGTRFVLGGRDFGADAEAFLDALGLEAWEREAVRAMTSTGHAGENPAVADVLAHHRDRLADGVESILPGQGKAFLAAHPGVEARTLLRLAREAAMHQEKTRDIPEMAGLGPLGSWVDRFARDARRLERAQLLHNVRREIPQSLHPAHLYAFLCAAGFQSEGERSFTPDQKAAGLHWTPLAKNVLEATGEAYRDAVFAYLRETGAGETA